MLIVPGSTGSASQITTLSYACKPDGTMNITVPNNHSLQIIGNSGCTNSTNGPGHIVLTNCKIDFLAGLLLKCGVQSLSDRNAEFTYFGLVQKSKNIQGLNKTQMIAVRHNKLFGGKLPVFSLLCEDFKYTITLNATEMINISNATNISKKVNHTNEITMKIMKGGTGVSSAVIGDKLSLVISAPKDFKIDPKYCNANSYAIWNASSTPKCNVEESVIEQNWTITKKNKTVKYSIVMYAFRLVGSNSVSISCTVDVCPSGVSGCTQKCVNSQVQRRKRRNAPVLNTQKVDRRLETHLRVYDSAEDKIQASGASALTTSYMAVLCALVSALYHMQS